MNLFLAALPLLGIATVLTSATVSPERKTLYDFSAKSIDGKEINLSQFKGKKVLIVNTASKCGYTRQYADLEKLAKKYEGKLVVIGFPANDFGRQEPGTNEEIKGFCQKNYGVSFQMMEKITVVGSDAHPLYKWLSKKEENGVSDGSPKWNFTKYLIDEKGNLVKMYPSSTEPLAEELTKAVEA